MFYDIVSAVMLLILCIYWSTRSFLDSTIKVLLFVVAVWGGVSAAIDSGYVVKQDPTDHMSAPAPKAPAVKKNPFNF